MKTCTTKGNASAAGTTKALKITNLHDQDKECV